MDFDIGTSHMTCGCRESAYMYAPTGHVVTGDLNIIQDRALRHLRRGPTFREQDVSVKRRYGSIERNGRKRNMSMNGYWMNGYTPCTIALIRK